MHSVSVQEASARISHINGALNVLTVSDLNRNPLFPSPLRDEDDGRGAGGSLP